MDAFLKVLSQITSSDSLFPVSGISYRFKVYTLSVGMKGGKYCIALECDYDDFTEFVTRYYTYDLVEGVPIFVKEYADNCPCSACMEDDMFAEQMRGAEYNEVKQLIYSGSNIYANSRKTIHKAIMETNL